MNTPKNPISKIKFALLLMALGLINFSAIAQTFEILKDINQGRNSSYPEHLAVHNGKLYFKAYSSDGLNPWISDGTTEGTTMLKNTNAIANGVFQSSVEFVGANGLVFFKELTRTHGSELWVSDGTTAGTHILKDINPGTSGSGPFAMTEINDKLYFNAEDGTHGGELWVTDGTEAGTQMVKDINPGSDKANLYLLFRYKDKLYFRANDGVHGNELWVSNGTSAGTKMIKDIQPGSEGSDLNNFTEVNGQLFFTANDGTHGMELWKTDGTSGGTKMVKDIRTNPNPVLINSDPRELKEFNGKLYFTARRDSDEGRAIWVSDGTTSGTQLLIQINSEIRGDSSFRFAHEYNGKLYFTGQDVEHGNELWATDGTAVGTNLVKDLVPGTKNGGPFKYVNYNNNLYFIAYHNIKKSQLWTSDGTAEGTHIIMPDNVNNIKSNGSVVRSYNDLVVFDGALYFKAEYDSKGLELWKYTSNSLSTEDHEINEFVLYPNPVQDVLHMKTNAKDIEKIDLFSVTGQRLKSWEGQSSLNMSPFAPGIYFIKVYKENSQTLVKRIVKN